MLSYTIKPGDTISNIAYKYQTKVDILKKDNPSVATKNPLIAGETLLIQTTTSYATVAATAAKNAAVASAAVRQMVAPSSANLIARTTGVEWQNLSVNEGQTGVVTITKSVANLYRFNATGGLKVLRQVTKNQKFRCYGSSNKHGGLYNLGTTYVKKSDASFETIPSSHRISTEVSTSVVTQSAKKQSAAQTAARKTSEIAIPQLEMVGHRRTRIQVKKPDGKNLNMELRLLAMNTNHSNQLGASRTNAGWMFNVGGKNLSSLTLNGFFLDTKTNREADAFINNYHKYFVPSSNDKHFKVMTATILHKGREYKGFITNLSIAEQSDAPIDRKFSMQFLVLREKGLSTSDIAEQYPFVVDRKGEKELEFLSSLRGMLTNPITGVYK